MKIRPEKSRIYGKITNLWSCWDSCSGINVGIYISTLYMMYHLNISPTNISNRYHHHDYSLWIDSRRVGLPQLGGWRGRVHCSFQECEWWKTKRMRRTVRLSPVICSRYLTVLPSHSFQSRLLWKCSFICLVSSHFSITLDNLKSCYNSYLSLTHIMSPSRCLFWIHSMSLISFVLLVCCFP